MQGRFRGGCRRWAVAVCATAVCVLWAPQCSAAIDVAQFAVVGFASTFVFNHPQQAFGHELEDSDDDIDVDTRRPEQLKFGAGKDSQHEAAEDLDFSRDSNTAAQPTAESRRSTTTGTTAPEPEWIPVEPPLGVLRRLLNAGLSRIPERDQEVWSLYWIEAVAALLTIIVGWHCYWGMQRNRQAACDWLDDALPFFNTQFAKVGFESSYLQSASWSSFIFYATGRANCKSLIATLEITPRQCFWMYQILGRMMPSLIEDQLIVEIPLDKMEMSALAIGKRIDLSRLKRTCQLLDEGSAIRTVPGLPSSLVVLSDNAEISERILTPEFVKILASREHLFKHLLIADKLSTEHYPNEVPAIHIRLALPATQAERRESLVLLQCIVTSFIDAVSHFKLSERAMKEVRKNRLELEKKVLRDAEAERAEQIELKRAKQKKEEEERIERMTPEQVRKWDEKQHKKSLKQRGPKIKMIS